MRLCHRRPTYLTQLLSPPFHPLDLFLSSPFLFPFIPPSRLFFFFFFNDPAPPEISPLPLHAALPISPRGPAPPLGGSRRHRRRRPARPRPGLPVGVPGRDPGTTAGRHGRPRRDAPAGQIGRAHV